MKQGLLRMAAMVVLLLGVCAAAAAGSGDVIQEADSGRVNWTRTVVSATGVQHPGEKASAQGADAQRLLSGAKVAAHHRLLETIMGVRLDAGRNVGEALDGNHSMMAEVQEMVKQAGVTHQEYLSDGTVAVTLEMALHGGFSQLVLPLEIEQIESITPVSAGQVAKGGGRVAVPADSAPLDMVYTGLVVDATAVDTLPALVFNVVTEAGQQVYGAPFVSREFAVQWGMASYAKTLTAAVADERLGTTPLIIKALRVVEPGSCDLVISTSDASRILGVSEHLSFLKQSRVIVVVR